MFIWRKVYKSIALLCAVISFIGVFFSSEYDDSVCVSTSPNPIEYISESVYPNPQDIVVFESVSFPQTFEAIRVSKYSTAHPLRLSSIRAAISLLMLFVILLLTQEILYLSIGNRMQRFHIITYIHNQDGAKPICLYFS